MISFVISSVGVGGAQVWVNQMARICATDQAVEVVYGGYYGGIPPRIAAELASGLSTVRLPGLQLPFNPVAIASLVRHLRQSDVQLVVCNSFGAGVNGRIAAWFSGIPAIYVSHGWSFRYQSTITRLSAGMVEALLARISIVLCISRADELTARKVLYAPAKNLALVRNRVVRQKRTVALEALPIRRDLRRVLFVGRMAAPKRFDLYIELAKQFRDVGFVAVGPRPEDFHQTPGNFIALGNIPGFDDYAAYDAFCLLSDSEGLPLSALEAHAEGIPLFLSNVGGCAELVDGNGLLVENTVPAVVSAFGQLQMNFGTYSQRAQQLRHRFVTTPAAVRRLVRRALRALGGGSGPQRVVPPIGQLGP